MVIVSYISKCQKKFLIVLFDMSRLSYAGAEKFTMHIYIYIYTCSGDLCVHVATYKCVATYPRVWRAECQLVYAARRTSATANSAMAAAEQFSNLTSRRIF